jgi:Tfp pilus assembly protein PilZ
MRVAVRDISGLGVLVEIPHHLLEVWPTLQTEVTLNLQLDDTHHIEAAGRVAWMGGQSIAHQRTYRAGLEFASLTHSAQRVLNHWMAHLTD